MAELPSVDQIMGLTDKAKIALSVRNARRLQPYLVDWRQYLNYPQTLEKIDTILTQIEQVTNGEISDFSDASHVEEIESIIDELGYSEQPPPGSPEDIANTALLAAYYAIEAANAKGDKDAVADYAHETLEVIEHVDKTTGASFFSAGAESDFDLLRTFVKDRSFIDCSSSGPLGLLMPLGEPEGYPDKRIELDIRLERKPHNSIKLPGVKMGDEFEGNIVSTDESPANFLIDPGSASAEEIAELYYEISKLYQMIGGTGVRFQIKDCRLPEFAEERL